MNRVEDLVEQFMRTRDPAALDEAVEAGRAAPGDPAELYSLGQALLLRFHVRNDPDDLEAAAGVLSAGVARGTEQQRLRALSMLAHVRLELYRARREAAELKQCIAEFAHLLQTGRLTENDAADLGQALVRLNELEEDPAHIENAITMLQAGLDFAEPGEIAENDCRMWLSTALFARFGAAGDEDDLQAGLALLREDPADGYREPDPGERLLTIAQLVLLQPAGEDLDRAAIALRAAARLSPEPLELLARTLLMRYVNDGHPEQVGQARRVLGSWDGFDGESLNPLLGNAFRELDQPGIGPQGYERVCRLLRFLDAVMPASWPLRGLIIAAFADAANSYYQLSPNQAIVDEAIDMLRRRPQEGDRHEAGAAALGGLLALRHHYPGHEQDLDEAVSVLRAAADTEAVRAALGPILLQRWMLRHDRQDLDAALAAMRRVVEDTPADDANRLARITNLATVLRTVYRADHDQRDLDEATALYRTALAGTAEDAPSYAMRAQGLGVALSLHDDRDSQAKGVELLRATVPRDQGPQRPQLLMDFATALRALGRATRNPDLLDEAITVLAECADAADTRAGALTMIVRTRDDRYQILGVAGDLDALVEAAREASAETPDALPDLGEALRVRADVTGSLEDAEEAVRVLRQFGEDTPAKKIAVGLALCSRFEAGGARADIEDAARSIEQALAEMDASDPERPGAESDLGLVLGRRWAVSGDPADLDRAIDLQRSAVQQAGSAHPDRARRLLNLSGPLRQRYEQFGALADLDESLRALRTVVFDLPYRAGERPELMADLGAALAERGNRTGESGNLVEATAILRQALDLMGAKAAARPKALSALATVCTIAARRSVAIEGLGQSRAALLDSAVELERAAVEAAGPGHYNAPIWRSNLAAVLFTRHQATGDRRDAMEAVSLLRAVLDAVDTQTPERGRWLANLAFGLTSLVSTTGVGYEDELAAYRAAADAATAPADVRVDAARWWGATAGQHGDWPEAVTGYSRALELLPLAVFRGLYRSDQEFKLVRLAGLASDAAACAVRVGDPGQALELLEQGRGILLAQALETRDEFSELEQEYPAQARRFRDLRGKLDSPQETDGDLMYRLTQQCNDLISEIRALPRFERFLLPPPSSDLRQAVPEGGAAVVVNVSQFGCDALIVTASRIEALPLPGLSVDGLLELSRDFLTATQLAQDPQASYETQVAAVDDFDSCLGRLSGLIVGPILRHLDIPPGATARLWWIPTGLSAFLPLHAAGDALDRVVSSYSPTLNSLARERRNPAGPGYRNGIIVTATAIPGRPHLTAGDREATQVAARLPSASLLPDATPAQVLEALGDANFAHFICHAHWDIDTPSDSRLILNGGELSVRQIAARRSPPAFLAYLSACSTSRGSVSLADESIHISSAFQMAGYRHVIASLWPVADGTACELATKVYQNPLSDPGTALRQAVLDLRDSDPGDIVNWTAIIHTGP